MAESEVSMPKTHIRADYAYVQSPGRDCETALRTLLNAPVIAYRPHFENLETRSPKIKLLALKGVNSDSPVAIFDLGKMGNRSEIVQLLKRPLIGHDANNDIEVLGKTTGVWATRVFCTKIAAQLIGMNRPSVSYRLEDIGERTIGSVLEAPENALSGSEGVSTYLLQRMANHTELLSRLITPMVNHLNTYHSNFTGDQIDSDIVKAFGLKWAPAVLEMSFLPAIANVRHSGIPFDAKAASVLLEKKQANFEAAERAFREATKNVLIGTPAEKDGINFHSSQKELVPLLVKRGAKLPFTENKNQKNLSTNEEALLRNIDIPEAKMVLALREMHHDCALLKKLIESCDETGRIHANFYSTDSTTFRISCSQPNLQSVDHEEEMRSLFRCKNGTSLIACDSPQQEIRHMAVIANDWQMKKLLNAGKDPYKTLGSLILGKNADAITDTERQKLKAVILGMDYGQSPEGLRGYAYQKFGLSLSLQECAMFQQKYQDVFKGYKLYRENLKKQLDKEGHVIVKTILGRSMVATYLQTALNYPIQGSAVEESKLAVINLRKAVQGKNMRLMFVNLIHDDQLIEANDGYTDEIKNITQLAKYQAMKTLGVPVCINDFKPKAAKSWADFDKKEVPGEGKAQ